MTVFTRLPKNYLLDRFAICIFAGITGVVLLLTPLLDAQILDRALQMIGPIIIFCIVCIGICLWSLTFTVHAALEIDEKELRIIYRPKKIVSIPRKNIIRVDAHKGYRFRGTMIYYTQGGKDAFFGLPGGWSSTDGTEYPDLEIATALQRALGIPKRKI